MRGLPAQHRAMTFPWTNIEQHEITIFLVALIKYEISSGFICKAPRHGQRLQKALRYGDPFGSVLECLLSVWGPQPRFKSWLECLEKNYSHNWIKISCALRNGTPNNPGG